MSAAESGSWREATLTAALVFAIATTGCAIAFARWLHDLEPPQIAILGSGNQLSLLVSEGPARLVLATGDDPIAYENALSRVRPLFARRIDVLLLAGSGESLLAPLAARGDPHVRFAAALAPLPPSAETDAIGPIPSFSAPQRIRLGPTVSVTVETMTSFGSDANESFPAWRATVERGGTRLVVLSDGEAASLFPPLPASVIVVSGGDPVAAWDMAPAVTLMANGEAIGGPELRAGLADERRPPEWGFRIFRGEALRLRFVADGLEVASESAQPLNGDPQAVSGLDEPTWSSAAFRRRPLWRARIHL
jgi:hypothetical protein